MKFKAFPWILFLCFFLAVSPAWALIEKSPFLDAALSGLEKGNIFLERYNELTGSCVEPMFELGIPYFFGGEADGGVFRTWPQYSKRRSLNSSGYFQEGSVYINGLDCAGYTKWIYKKAGYPVHDTLGNMILNYWEYAKNHVYTHREGQQMPPFEELKDTLQIGDLFVFKKPETVYRHIMMFIGTLADYGFTAENEPELKDYLNYPLCAHCGNSPLYGDRFQRFIDDNPVEYGRCLTTDGGVQVSLIGIPPENVPYHVHVQQTDYDYFLLSDGTWLTVRNVFGLSSYCWFRMNP